eukprot:Skav214167  [mRNA]  locus=scaffold945:225662:235267:+ [translate_table: standard]
MAVGTLGILRTRAHHHLIRCVAGKVGFRTHMTVDGQRGHVHHGIARAGDANHRDIAIEELGEGIVKCIVANPRGLEVVRKSNAVTPQLQHVHGQGCNCSAQGMPCDQDRSLRRAWNAAIVDEHTLHFALDPRPYTPKAIEDLTAFAVLVRQLVAPKERVVQGVGEGLGPWIARAQPKSSAVAVGTVEATAVHT